MDKLKFFSKFLDGSIIQFKDRQNASEMLYLLLKNKLNKVSTSKKLILGIPRGGIIIGDILATKLGSPLKIIIPKRLVSPQNKELSIGGIMNDNTLYLNTFLVKQLGITNEYLRKEKEKKIKEIRRRELLLGPQVDTTQVEGKNIILVDDGAATGATLIVTLRWLRKCRAKYLIVAIPICPLPTLTLLKKEADQVESIITPDLSNFKTIDAFYKNFKQLDFDEIITILKKHRALNKY